MQNFATSIWEHVKNIGTKPVQSDLTGEDFHRHFEQKNPGSAATETGIFLFKYESVYLPNNNASKGLIKAISNQLGEPVVKVST